jgi:uroporphyrinogen-III decarboxylase
MDRFVQREPDKERMRATLLRQQADHVPYWESTICRRNLEFLFERKDMPDLSWSLPEHEQVQIARLTGQDVIPGRGGMIPHPRVQNSDGTFRYLNEGELTTWELLEALVPYTDDELRRSVALLDASFDVAANTGIGVWVGSGAMWQRAWQMVGFNEFMVKFLVEPDFVRRLIAYISEPQVRIAKMLAEYPLTFFGLGDNIATTKGPFVDPKSFKELWCPWAKAIIAPAKVKGIPVVLNTDGRIDWVLDDIVEIGSDAINPVDPNGNDIFEVKEKYGDRLCLIGGVNQAWPLAFGTPEDVDRTVRDCIERLGQGGGYVVSSSHDIGDNVPPENWVAMVRAVEKYG